MSAPIRVLIHLCAQPWVAGHDRRDQLVAQVQGRDCAQWTQLRRRRTRAVSASGRGYVFLSCGISIPRRVPFSARWVGCNSVGIVRMSTPHDSHNRNERLCSCLHTWIHALPGAVITRTRT